jgi:hypothetical protein
MQGATFLTIIALAAGLWNNRAQEQDSSQMFERLVG